MPKQPLTDEEICTFVGRVVTHSKIMAHQNRNYLDVCSRAQDICQKNNLGMVGDDVITVCLDHLEKLLNADKNAVPKDPLEDLQEFKKWNNPNKDLL